MENKKKEKKKIKKILFISPRNPFSGRFSGDVIRTKKIINYLKKKYDISLISLDKLNSKKKVNNIKIITFKKSSFFFNLVPIIKNLLKLRPLQLGYFFSNKMNIYILNNFKNFDIIFCQSFRTAQFVEPLNCKKKILDMGDLYSKNYYQTFKNLNFFNPIKYIYFLESLLMKKYEILCFKKFDKIFLFSKKNIGNFGKRKKIIKIDYGIDGIKKIYKFDKSNYKIIFIGNLKYLPNRIACDFFIKKILPRITKIDPNIELHLIGEISILDKFFWEKNKSVKIHGEIKNLLSVVKKSFCSLANLNISPAPNTKVLTYMSYGIPCIVSKIVKENFHNINSNLLPIYNNDEDLIRLIFKIKKNKKFSEYLSKKGLEFSKKFKWKKIFKNIENLN